MAFAAVGAMMIRENMPAGWLILVLCGAGSAVFLILLIRPNRLEITAGGITVDPALGRRWSAEWKDCSPFRVYDVGEGLGSKKVVIFDCAIPTGHGRRLRRFNQVVADTNAWLPETYGMRASELAALLNRHREASGQPAAVRRPTLASWLRSKRAARNTESAP